MKRVDFKKHSPVFYIGKGLIIGSVVVTASLGFLLGFFVGKQVHPLPETTSNSTVSLPGKEPSENVPITPVDNPLQQQPETIQMSAPGKDPQPIRDQHVSESRTTTPGQTPGGGLRETVTSSSEKPKNQAASQRSAKTQQATKSAQTSPEKKDPKTTQDKQKSPQTAAIRKYTVQIGAFKNPEEADALKTKMGKKGYKAFVTAAKTKKQEILHKVMVGEYKTRKEAEVLSVKLKNSEGLRTFVSFFMQEGATRQQ